MKKLGALAVAAACLLLATPAVSSAQAPAVSAPAPASPASPLIANVLGPASRLDEDLRVLTDEIGGRITGSAGYEKSLRWGQDAFRRAGVDSVKLEAYDAPARWEPESASAKLVAPEQFPVRVVSFGLAPSTPGALTAPLVDAGEGRARRLPEPRAESEGRDRPGPLETHADLPGPLHRIPRRARDGPGGGGQRRRRDPLHLDPAAHPAVPAHEQLGRHDRPASGGAGGARGRAAPAPTRRKARRGEAVARRPQPGGRAMAAAATSSPRSGDPRSPKRSCSSGPTWMRGISGRERSTTVSTAR